MPLIDFVCLCVWFSFFFKRERERTVFQNRCKSTLTPSWGRQGNLHKRKARRTHVAGCLNLWTVSKVGKAALCRSLQAQTGCPPRHKLGLWWSGCWDEKEKAKITKRQTKLLLHVSLVAPSGGTRERDGPVQALGVASEAPEKLTLWIRVTDPLRLLPTQYPLKSFTYISSFTLITLGVDALVTHMCRPGDGHSDFWQSLTS